MRKIIIAAIAIIVLVLAVLTVKKEINKNSNIEAAGNETVFESGSAAQSALYGWGDNSSSQIVPDPDKKQKAIVEPIKIADISSIKLFAGEASAGYLSSEKEVAAWGANEIHQINASEDLIVFEKQKITLPENAATIASTNRHTLVLTEQGDVYSWGYNYTGQLGTGTNVGERTPVKVSGIKDIASIASGYKFSLALSEDGKVYGWGGLCAPTSERAIVNFAASIVGGTAYYEPTILPRVRTSANEDCVNQSVVGILSKSPKLFSGVENVAAISAGYGHGLFLKKDGTVWSFGCNLYGQLGNRGTTNSPSNAVPQQIENLNNIKAISAGFRHSLALTADGKVYSWGGKIVEGKTGPEAEKNKDLVLIEGLPEAEKIIAGRDYSLAITKDGKLFGWGSNAHHQLSAESKKVFVNPIEIKLPGSVVDVAAGQSFVLAAVAQ